MRQKKQIVGILSILFVTIIGVLVIRYQPALANAPGHKLWFATQPALLENVPRIIEQITERRTCEYEILGWTDNNTVYYKASCVGGVEFWRYVIDGTSSSEMVLTLPDNLQITVISRKYVLNSVRAVGVHPQKYEPITRPLLLASVGYISPAGERIAFVTQHLYGPQDVIIVNRVPGDNL